MIEPLKGLDLDLLPLILSFYYTLKNSLFIQFDPMKITLLQIEEALFFIANQALEYDIYEQELLIVEKIVAKMTHIH